MREYGTNHIGKKYHMLTVLKVVDKPVNSKDKHRFYLCKCDCGNTKVISGCDIGYTKSCGCLKHESRKVTHGFASHKNHDRLYHIWSGMKYRCNNPKSKDYKHYGGRGIKICDEWLHDFVTFRNWALANGYNSNLTIDRINVDGNYCPENCKWSTIAEQNRNKTTTRRRSNDNI